MSNCQIIGPCSQILVVCVFSQYAFTFTSCLLPPLCWNNFVWSDPSFLPKKWGGNLSWKHHFCWWDRWKVFGDVCWLSLKGRVEWFVALEVLLGCLWVGMGNLCLLKACRKCSKHWVDKAKKKSRNNKWVCLAEKRKFLVYYYSYCKWKRFTWPADCTQHNYYYY